MKHKSHVVNDKWRKLTENQQMSIVNRAHIFLCAEDKEESVELDITPMHLIGIYKYYDCKLKEISELVLTELYDDIYEINDAVESIKKSNLQETCQKIKKAFDELEDNRI